MTMRSGNSNLLAIVCLLSVACTAHGQAVERLPLSVSDSQEPEPKADGKDLNELAKKLSNPVAALISVPIQSNFDWGYGRNSEGFRYTANIQPVVPISIRADWNVISRTILPVIVQDDVIPGDDHQAGIGDIVQSLFFSPKDPGPSGVIWGLGPVFLIPTASDDLLGAEKWGFGPTLVVLKQDSGWTYGALLNQIWGSMGKSSRQNVSAMFLQPFLAYGVAKGMTLTLNTETTIDWENHQWTVPVNLMVSQVVPISGQLVSFSLGARYYAEKPDGGPEWGLRFVVTFLFPK